MRNKIAGIILASAIIAFVLVYRGSDGFQFGGGGTGISIEGQNAGVQVVPTISRINPDGTTIVGSDQGLGVFGLSVVTPTPGTASAEAWMRQHPLDVSGSQDVAFWHVAACISACVRQTGTGFAPGADDLTVHPIYIGNAGTFGEIMVVVDTAVAATTARVGIYEGIFTDATHEVYVGNLVEDYGTIDTSTTGIKQRLCTVCATITPGLYFIALIVDDTSVRFERLDDGGIWSVPFGVFNNGLTLCPGWEVDNFTAAHTALPSVFPTPGPAIQCSSLSHSLWIGVELND